MRIPLTHFLFLANLSPTVLASLARAPVITPAAVLPRANSLTLGWFSSTVINGETLYTPWPFDADQATFTTSGQWFRRCGVGSTCGMYTGCSNGYMLGESTVSYCGAGGAATSPFCSNHILCPSMGASTTYSWFWCDTLPLTGLTIFAQEPSQPSIATQSSATSDASATNESTSTNPPAGTNTGDASNGSTGSSINIGAIAGGVVAGVAVLCAIGVAIFFVLRKKRKPTTGNPPGGYEPPYQQGGYLQSPNADREPTAYQENNGHKPAGVHEIGGDYVPQSQRESQSYPLRPYDPHQSQYYPPSAPPFVASQGQHEVPASLLAELPTTQR